MKFNEMSGQGSGPSRHVRRGPAAALPHSSPAFAAAEAADPRRKVLLADDSPDSLVLMELCLRKRQDLRLIFARSGKEALEKFNRFAFALVLTDMEMPEMDGYTAAGLMRKAPGGAEVPIVALTAHQGAAAVQKCLDAGCDECLTKPFSMAGLLAVVEKYVRQEADTDGRAELVVILVRYSQG